MLLCIAGCPFGDGAHNPNGSRLPAADLGAVKVSPPLHFQPADAITELLARDAPLFGGIIRTDASTSTRMKEASSARMLVLVLGWYASR